MAQMLAAQQGIGQFRNDGDGKPAGAIPPPPPATTGPGCQQARQSSAAPPPSAVLSIAGASEMRMRNSPMSTNRQFRHHPLLGVNRNSSTARCTKSCHSESCPHLSGRCDRRKDCCQSTGFFLASRRCDHGGEQIYGWKQRRRD